MASFEEKLVRAIKRKRESEGLSIRGLATVVGVSFSTLARIERGEGQPDNNSKIRLLEWLGADAEDAGLGFDNVAFVHFRAAKNVSSGTVRALLAAAEELRGRLGPEHSPSLLGQGESDDATLVAALSKEELEQTAREFRKELGLAESQPVDSLQIQIDGVRLVTMKDAGFDGRLGRKLQVESASEWSAMSVPLDISNDIWVVLLNDTHTIERQRVTLLEEYWHILLGHKLTKIAKIAEAYGRTYDSSEEHDAYYLASATLLPRAALVRAIKASGSAEEVSRQFGTSPELVEYRIKRLGLWRDYIGKKIRLAKT